ncbi:MAG: HypC/HybG/HupF family hydrogenase formation chaperone [Myxococcales bacterium]|nr:HypC/HybG/HupF family hydrogenase formation chaperone [Myxococcales bacterium]
MCLGVPGRILSIEGLVAEVDFWGVRKAIRLDIVDAPVASGDYILNHVGYAIRRIPLEEVAETLALYEALIRLAERDDLMARDVRGEIAAGGSSAGSALQAAGGEPGGGEIGGGDV